MTETETCLLDHCVNPSRSLRLCATHYTRLHRHGTTDMAEVRFWRSVLVTDGCWLWTGTTNPKGYGQFQPGQELGFPIRTVPAHHWSYWIHVGSIPDGMELDHLCRTRNCVNPNHLEPVTRRENVLRGETLAGINARKTHCKRGHDLSEHARITRQGTRQCRACVRYLRKEARGR